MKRRIQSLRVVGALAAMGLGLLGCASAREVTAPAKPTAKYPEPWSTAEPDDAPAEGEPEAAAPADEPSPDAIADPVDPTPVNPDEIPTSSKAPESQPLPEGDSPPGG